MLDETLLDKLFKAFPHGYINRNLEFVIHKNMNSCISLRDLGGDIDVQYRLLEKLSLNAYCHDYIREGINEFCGTDFSRNDMEVIYDALGNSKDTALTARFLFADYNIDWLRKELVRKKVEEQ